MATASMRLRVTQLVRGSRDDVFEAFSDPKLARKWAPEGCRMASFEADMHVGGKFRQVMQCGRDRHVAHGEYRKIVPAQEVAFTHQWEEDDPVETLVTVRFKPGKSGTEVALSQTGFKDAASAKGHREGWSSALASFAKVFRASRRKPR